MRVFTKLVRVSKPSAVRSVTGVLELCYRLNRAAQPTVLATVVARAAPDPARVCSCRGAVLRAVPGGAALASAT